MRTKGGRVGRGCNNIGRYRSLIRHAAREREIRSKLDERRAQAIPPLSFDDLSSFLPPPRPVDGFGAALKEDGEQEDRWSRSSFGRRAIQIAHERIKGHRWYRARRALFLRSSSTRSPSSNIIP